MQRGVPEGAGAGAREPSVGRKIAFGAVAVVGALLLLEGVARLTVPRPTTPTQTEHERLIRVLGLPALNETMEFDPDLFWRLKPELRGLRVEGHIRSHAIDFRVTTHRGLRSLTPLGTKSRFRVLAIGDSCTFGLGVEDGETWPAQLEGLLRRAGVDADVINAGVPGYTAFQGKRFLETRGLALDPDLVLVSFGFNDIDRGMPSSDAETARMLAVVQWRSMLTQSRLVWGMKLLLDRIPGLRPAGPQGERPRLTEQEFLETLGAIKGLCDARGIGMLVVVWPYEAQVTQREPAYVHYQIPAARFCQDREVDGVNLVTAFLRANEPLFLDHVHANPAGCRVAAEALFPWVAPRAVQAGTVSATGPERR